MTDTAIDERPDETPAVVITESALTNLAKFDPLAREIEAARMMQIEIALEIRRGKLEPGEELTDDDRLTAQDTFDGATPLDTVIRDTLLDIIELGTVAPGIDAVVANLRARKDRAAKDIAWRRALIERAMVMANWTTKEKALKFDVASVNVRPATATVEIVNEADVPAEFFVRADPTLDKRTLNTKVMGRYKALTAALALKDDNERGAALAKIETDFGPEIPGCQVKVDGYTTTIKFT